MKKITLLYILLAGLILAGCMFGGFITAEDKVEKTFETTAAPTVIVETFNGSITVQGNSGSSVEVEITRRGSGSSDAEARADLDNVLVETNQDGNTIHITVKRNDNHMGNTGASIKIKLPSTASLNLSTSNGAISVEDVQGDTRLSTSNGNLEITGGRGVLNLNTSNGRIQVQAEEATVNANTSNGAITFTGSFANGNHTFTTSNARVELSLPAETIFSVSATTSNGKVNSDFSFSGGSQGDTYLNGSTGNDPQINVNIATSNGTIDINKK